MATPEQIREAFEKIAKNSGPAVSNIAKVVSVNEQQGTCVLQEDDDDIEINDVRLRPVLTGNESFLMIPKVGTYALAIRVEDDDDWMIIACDQVEKFLWKTATGTIEVSDMISLQANGQSLATILNDLFAAIANMVFTTPDGPTTSLVNLSEFMALKTRCNNLLK